MTQCEPGEEIITVITCEYRGSGSISNPDLGDFYGDFLEVFWSSPEERGTVRGGVTL